MKNNNQGRCYEETLVETFDDSNVFGCHPGEEPSEISQGLSPRNGRMEGSGLLPDSFHRVMLTSRHLSLVLCTLGSGVIGWLVLGIIFNQGSDTVGMTSWFLFACFICATLTLIAGIVLRFLTNGQDLRVQSANVAFRNLDEAVLMTDADCRIEAVNSAFTQISGYNEEDIMGEDPSIFSSGRHAPSFYRTMWRSIKRNGSWEGEIWNRRKNGDVYPEWLKIAAVSDKQGRTTGYVGIFNDLSDLRAKDDRLRELSYHDQLTSLYNRNAFMELCEHALHRAHSNGTNAALLYVNLDRFKRINDSLGHKFGDSLLQQVAERIREALHKRDEAARLGGDEFIILLEDFDRETAAARACEALLKRMRQPFYSDSQCIYLTVSIGISMFPQDGEDLSTLLRKADATMYLAKHAGRDGYRYFAAKVAEETQRFFFMEASLREAISQGQLRLVYQPQISMSDGKVTGLEALLRWQHPVEGLIAPGRFLAAARLAGLMQPLTEWVLHEAARQSKLWREANIPVGRIACNLDAQSFQLSGLEKQLEHVVRNAGIHPSDIELEILETAMQLNFDRSFVKDIEWDENDRSIVRTVVAMAKTLGKKTLAEGVETAEQLRFLIDAGCDAIQGFYFSRPVPPEEIPALVRQAAVNSPMMIPLCKAPGSCPN